MSWIVKILEVDQRDPPNEDMAIVRFKKICNISGAITYPRGISITMRTPKDNTDELGYDDMGDDVYSATVPVTKVNEFSVIDGTRFARAVHRYKTYELQPLTQRYFWFWEQDIEIPEEVLFRFADRERDTRKETSQYWDHKIDLKVIEKEGGYTITLTSYAPDGNMSGARTENVSNNLLVDETIDEMLVDIIMDIRDYENVEGELTRDVSWSPQEELTLNDRIEAVEPN